MKITALLSLLAGLAVAGLVNAPQSVPLYVETGSHFLPPVPVRLSPPPVHRLLTPSPFTIDSFPSPDTTPFGLAFDGSNLWNVDLRAQTIFALDPVTGTVRRSFGAPGQWCKGLCWDGAYLWVTDNNQSYIHRVDTTSGSVVQSFMAPGSNPAGLAFDGASLWCADINSDQSKPSFIFKLDPANGMILDSFEAPCRMVADMDWDGTRLWVCDMDNSIAYGMDPGTGLVTRATGTPGPMPTGLAFIGARFVNSDWSTKHIYLYQPDSGPAAITIDRPAQWDVLPTWVNPAVIGTVVGAGLDSSRVEYGIGEQPVQWLRVGATRTAPAYRDTLAVWNVSGITQPGPYSLRIKAFFAARVDSVHARTLGIDPQIASGWPKTFANVSPVACADIAGDAKLEVIAGLEHQNFMDNKLGAWRYEGDALPGFPVPGIGLCQMPAATGDANQDGRHEIATGFDLNHHEVFLVRGSGAIMSGWPQEGGRPGSLQYHGIPVFAMVDSEMPAQYHLFSGGGRLSGWDSAGTALRGWPADAEYSSPALADIDRDGHAELVTLRRDSVYAYEDYGSLVPGWPVGFGSTGGSTFPVAGDLNDDDEVEIAFTIGTRLFCTDDSGRVLSGFPKNLTGTYSNSPVLGDVDNDGSVEIIVVSGAFPSFSTISVYSPDGSSPTGWPRTLNGQVFRTFNAPVVGDVDGDGHADIVMGLESVDEGFARLFAWDYQGNSIDGWPKLLRFIYGYGITGSPVLADMNEDGLLECAVSSNAYWMYNTDIYLWNLGVPCVPVHQPWPMFRHDPRLTAFHQPLQTGISEQVMPGERIAAPQPTVARGAIFVPPSPDRSDASSLLDISGRRVMDLRPGTNPVSSLSTGVYFIRAGGARANERVVILR